MQSLFSVRVAEVHKVGVSTRTQQLLVIPLGIKIGMVMALGLLASGCRKNGPQPNLHDRIVAANTQQYCHPDACFNPHVLAVETGYSVTTFSGPKPQYAQVTADQLAKYLQALPMQAWPRGASISMSPSDDVMDEHAIEQNLHAAEQLCRSMGLAVQMIPGG